MEWVSENGESNGREHAEWYGNWDYIGVLCSGSRDSLGVGDIIPIMKNQMEKTMNMRWKLGL